MKTNRKESRQFAKGFTLAESVIALGILVVLITGFLAVFGPAARTIKKTLSTDEASRLQSSLVGELGTIREGREERQYEGNAFRKAIDWITNSEQEGQAILVYKYRAIQGERRDDGTLQPSSEGLGIAGQDYIVRPMVRRLSDPFLQEDLEAVEGRVFFVKLRQLVYSGDGLRVAEETGTLVDPNNPGDDFTSRPDRFPESVIAFEAEYYDLPTTSFNYLENAFDPTEFTRPIFSRNLSVRR